MRRIALFFFTLLFASYLSAQDQDVMRLNLTIPTGSLSFTELVINRFLTPLGYHRVPVKPASFAEYLQRLPLKPAGTPARTYTGETAFTDAYTAAVVDMNLTGADHQHCPEAVMRLRAEYLYRQKKYSKIAFHFDNGFLCDFVHYADGYRCQNGNWAATAKKDYSYNNFQRYLDLVFTNSGVSSLQRQLKKVKNAAEVQAGDVFIRDMAPAHCFIVIHVIENKKHRRQFLLAQGFAPAQDIQILRYEDGPWFSMEKPSGMLYGELISKDYLERFED